jgi:putative Mn2+ efflux pump MntP
VQRTLKRYIPYIQQAALALSVAGLVFYYMKYTGAGELLMLGLSLLSGAYFLWAFLPMDTPPHSEPDAYAALVHKLIYISCSVLLVGVLFTFLHLEGHHEMMLIGGITLLVALAGSIMLMIKKRENFVSLRDAFVRGISSALLGVLVLSQNANP